MTEGTDPGEAWARELIEQLNGASPEEAKALLEGITGGKMFTADDMEHDPEIEKLGWTFTKLLCDRKYEEALLWFHSDVLRAWTVAKLKEGFERSVYADASAKPIEVMWTMSDWPAKGPGDIAMTYVAITGTFMYEGTEQSLSEAVTLTFANDGPQTSIREIEFGRP